MPLKPTPPATLIPLTATQWAEKLRDIATMRAVRHHYRSSDLWFLYTPEAEALMNRTYTKTPAKETS